MIYACMFISFMYSIQMCMEKYPTLLQNVGKILVRNISAQYFISISRKHFFYLKQSFMM